MYGPQSTLDDGGEADVLVVGGGALDVAVDDPKFALPVLVVFVWLPTQPEKSEMPEFRLGMPLVRDAWKHRPVPSHRMSKS